MTQYTHTAVHPSSLSARAQEAKAKRQVVLRRVRAQRAQTYKRSVTDWMQEGVIIRASELKERYQQKRSVVEQ